MAFWGTEVKPGKPYTHSFDRVRGRLHISQATLAIGTSTNKSLVQCNVGDKCPVLLCALLPDKTESLQLDLEFEETEDVILSVIGPRGVHLTGYYVGSCRNSKFHDDTRRESYGEDINTDTEESNRCIDEDEDEYEDSFINDGEPEALTPSPASSDGVDEEVFVQKLRDGIGSRNRLKKKYQLVESDDETSSQQNIVNGSTVVPESDDEDKFPISTVGKNKTTATNTVPKKKQKELLQEGKITNSLKDVKPELHDEIVQQSDHNLLDAAEDLEAVTDKTSAVPYESLVSPVEAGIGIGKKTIKKRKVQSKKQDSHIDDNIDYDDGNKEDDCQQAQAVTGNIDQGVLTSNKADWKPTNEITSAVPYESLVSPVEAGIGNGKKIMKKKKVHSKKQDFHKDDNGDYGDGNKEDDRQQAEAEPGNIDQGVLTSNKDDRKSANEITSAAPHESLVSPVEAGIGNGKKIMKKKKVHSKKQDFHKDDNGDYDDGNKEDDRQQAEAEPGNIDQGVLTSNKDDRKSANEITSAAPYESLVSPVEAGIGNGKKIMKKKKVRSKKQDFHNDDTGDYDNGNKEDDGQQTEAEPVNIDQGVLTSNKDESLVFPVEAGIGNGKKIMKKKQVHSKKQDFHKDDNGDYDDGNKEDDCQQVEAEPGNIDQGVLTSNKEDRNSTNEITSAVTYESLVSPVEAGIGNGKMIMKKKKLHSKKQDFHNDDNGDYGDGNKEYGGQQAEAEPGDIDQGVLTSNKDDWKSTNEMPVDLSHESMIPSVDLVPQRSSKGKKKRKKCSEVNNDFSSNDLLVGTEPEKKPTNYKSSNIASDQLGKRDQPDDRDCKMKRRKKSKTEEIEENFNIEVKEDKSKSTMESEEKTVDTRLSEPRTLSNGLIVEDLGRGENSRGKKAAAGRKVKVIKLKENGHVVDSNIGKSPYKFRLGDKEVIDEINLGVEGMQVGDKR